MVNPISIIKTKIKIKSYAKGSRLHRVTGYKLTKKRFHKKRSRYIWKRRFSAIFKFIKESYLFIIFLAFFVLIYLFTRTNVFIVKEIQFTGVTKIDKTKLQAIADKYKGKNIYLINLGDVENDVYDCSVYVKSVYAKKYLPSKLVIDIDERDPSFSLLDFDGVFLIDKEGKVVSSPIHEKISFEQEEVSILSTMDFDLDIVKSRIIANATDEELSEWLKDDADKDMLYKDETDMQSIKALIDFSKIPDDMKLNTFLEIRNEVTQIVDEHFNSLNEQINQTEFANLPRVLFYKNNNLNNGDLIDATKLDILGKVLSFFARREDYSMQYAIWISDYTLKVTTLENKEFIFSDTRDIKMQLNDLDVMINELHSRGEDFTSIDVRSEIIAVK